MNAYIAIDIKYLVELSLLLRQRWRAAEKEKEKRRDSARRHFEVTETTGVLEKKN